jgi:hypothetical protein
VFGVGYFDSSGEYRYPGDQPDCFDNIPDSDLGVYDSGTPWAVAGKAIDRIRKSTPATNLDLDVLIPGRIRHPFHHVMDANRTCHSL